MINIAVSLKKSIRSVEIFVKVDFLRLIDFGHEVYSILISYDGAFFGIDNLYSFKRILLQNWYDHLNKSYWVLPLYGTVYYCVYVQGGSNV